MCCFVLKIIHNLNTICLFCAVADRVAKKSHKICGRPVDVKLYIPPKPKPTYPNKLLFKSVADSTTRDCLSMYLERVTDMEPQDILYGDEVGNVLVTFDGEPGEY